MGWGKYIITRVVAPFVFGAAIIGCGPKSDATYPITQEEFLESTKTTKIIPYFHRLSETERLLANKIAFNRRKALGNESDSYIHAKEIAAIKKALAQEVAYRKQDEKERWGTILPLSDALKDLEPAQEKLIDELRGIEKVFAAYKTEQERERNAAAKTMDDYKNEQEQQREKDNKATDDYKKGLEASIAAAIKKSAADLTRQYDTGNEDQTASIEQKIAESQKAVESQYKKDETAQTASIDKKLLESKKAVEDLLKGKASNETIAKLQGDITKYQTKLEGYIADNTKLKGTVDSYTEKNTELEKIVKDREKGLKEMEESLQNLQKLVAELIDARPIAEIVPLSEKRPLIESVPLKLSFP
ncbi:hypothetical protein GOV06_03780 [Candidatus Woesearchaeota archaeon]|nr:hypothetical protein [Candidatus Woesearchaeota archaeon]